MLEIVHVDLIEPHQLEEISNLSNSIYPQNYYEPFECFQSRHNLYPQGCLSLSIDTPQGKQIAGYCFFHPWHDNHVPLGTILTAIPCCSTGYIHDFAIAPALRDKKLGKTLANAALNKMKLSYFNQCQLVAVNNSFGFWEKLGFQKTEEIEYGGSGAAAMELNFRARINSVQEGLRQFMDDLDQVILSPYKYRKPLMIRTLKTLGKTLLYRSELPENSIEFLFHLLTTLTHPTIQASTYCLKAVSCVTSEFFLEIACPAKKDSKTPINSDWNPSKIDKWIEHLYLAGIDLAWPLSGGRLLPVYDEDVPESDKVILD